MPQLWDVVGGADKGGLLVRNGAATTSKLLIPRLSTGARVEELALEGDRLHYKRLTGTGPDEGWIAIALPGKELARRVEEKEQWNPYAVLGVDPEATDAQIKSAFRKGSLAVHPDRNPNPEAASQFRQLTDAKEFLLNPLKRLMYNMRHGHQPRRHYVQWWSDWNDVYGEIDPTADVDEEKQGGAGEDSGGARADAAVVADAAVSAPMPEEAPQAPPVGSTLDAKNRHDRIDVVIFGATGFVGMLACSMVHKQLPGRTWAIAGRDQHKLQLLEDKFGKGSNYRGKMQLEVPEDLDRIVGAARIVVDFSGPKWTIGNGVAEACIRMGTHLVENTSFPGDTLFQKTAYEDLGPEAESAGVSLCYFCGVGTTLFDIGAWLLAKHLREHHGEPTRRIDAYEISRGASITGSVMLAARGPPSYEKDLKKTGYFFLGGQPVGGLEKEDEEQGYKPEVDEYAHLWRNHSEIPEDLVTRCSSGLSRKLGQPYGDSFRFRVWNLFGDQSGASMNALRLSNQFLRRGYDKHIELKKIPGPTQGPCERMRKEAVSTRVFVAESEKGTPGQGRRAHCVCQAGPGGMADHQEGTAATALAACGCQLDALDAGHTLVPGFGTPSQFLCRFGMVERLAALGMAFEIRDGAPAPELFHNFMSSAGVLQG